MFPLNKATSALLACLLTIFPVLGAFGQGETRRGQSFGDLTGFDLNPLQQMTGMSRMAEAVPMEGAVDPQEYLVGPGDRFDISVGGPQPLMVTLPVSADGHLMLPEAGAVNVADRTLAEARRIAVAALREQFRNVKVEVTLSQPRQFYVHVSGAVPTPGRYVATPVARLATVLNMAYADTSRAPVSNTSFRPSLRNVKVIHKDGSDVTVDLLRYYSTGNTEHNPYLRDGDVISISTYDPNYDAVYVSGRVAFPGTYDYRPDDSLHDLLVLTTGQNPPRGIKQVRLTRSDDDGSVETEIYNIENLDGSVRVRERDQIHVLSEQIVRGTATVAGWVEYPGTYPIVPGETTLKRLVELAGGLRQGALARDAYLQRATLPMPEATTSSQNRFEQAATDFRMIRSDTLAIMKDIRLANLDFLSRAYLAHELRLQNRVPIDLNARLHGEADPIYLQDGDKVFVPRDENSIFVFGQVNRPGYVTYQPNRPLDYYVSASGGFSENAGDAFVIEAGTGRYLDARRAEIQSGDKIFVNRSMNRAESAELQRLLYEERRADLERTSRTWQNVVQSIGAATAVITTYLFITRE